MTLRVYSIIYIYIYAFSRRFYPKRLTLHSSDSFYILSALAFPGNRTHDLGVANAMLYQLSYRKAINYNNDQKSVFIAVKVCVVVLTYYLVILSHVYQKTLIKYAYYW